MGSDDLFFNQPKPIIDRPLIGLWAISNIFLSTGIQEQ